MPDPHARGRGNLLVQTIIEVPNKLSKKQEELLRQLAHLDNEHVTPERKGFMDRILSYFQNEESKTTADKE